MRTIEEMLNDLPMRVSVERESKCPYCGQENVKRNYTYELRSEIYLVGNNKRYKLYYKLIDYKPYNPLIPDYIESEYCNYKSISEAIDGIKQALINEGIINE